MSEFSTFTKYYSDVINLKDGEALEAMLQTLLQMEITSVADLEEWLAEERKLRDEIGEAMSGHRIDFYRDTFNADKRDIYLHDQTHVQPLLTKYLAGFDKKFCECPFFLERLIVSVVGASWIGSNGKQALIERYVETFKKKMYAEIKNRSIVGNKVIDWGNRNEWYNWRKYKLNGNIRGRRSFNFKSLVHSGINQ